ncbi:MAG: hypothetical protein WC760_01875 [Bacteroidia bacterium]|jgi:hypothetical protein
MKKKQKKLIHKLKNRYRLVLINDATFEEKFSYSLTPINVFVGFSSFLVFFALIIISLIVFTPMKEFIPGYTDPAMKRNITRMISKTDSLEEVLRSRDAYYRNILDILQDKDTLQ